MNGMAKAVGEVLTNLITTNSACEDPHVCPHCKQVVEKKEVTVLGITKVVQPRCHCEVKAMEQGVQESVELKLRRDIEAKFSISKLGERFQESRFSSFTSRDGSNGAAKIASNYAKTFGDYGHESLLIWGEPGNGKSHLAAAICHYLRERDKTPVFASVPELLERIRSTFNQRSKESEIEIMDALRNCDLLVLDDIGSEKVSDWVLDVLFRIVDGRYRKKKPTLFTTNFSPNVLLNRFMPEKPTAEDEIAAKRIHDRILEVSIIVENKGSSYRREVAMERAKKLREA